MESYWSKFISENKAIFPYLPLCTILEAFYWYMESLKTFDNAYKENAEKQVLKLLKQ